MKKILLLITGALLIAATAQANCGTCDAAGAKDKAACAVKKGECAKDKAACAVKQGECAKDKAACAVKQGECSKDEACAMKAKKCGADCNKPCCAEKKGFFQKLKFWK